MPFGKWVCSRLKSKNLITIAMDYPGSDRETVGGFQKDYNKLVVILETTLL